MSNTHFWGFSTLSLVDVKMFAVYSAIHKATSGRSSQLEPLPGTIPATGSIHGLWEFQEFYQAKSWNGQEL